MLRFSCFYLKNDFIAELFLEEGDDIKPKGYDVRKGTMPASNKTQINRKKTVGSQVINEKTSRFPL